MRKKPKRKTIEQKRNLNKDFGKFAANPSMHSITNYIPYNPSRDLKKWCIEMAVQCHATDAQGNRVQVEPIKMAQKIFDWVIKSQVTK